MWKTLSKFGLGYCDLPTLLRNVALMLRAVTLNIDNRFEDRIPTVFYITTPILIFCYFYTYVLSAWWFVFVRCMETRDFDAAVIVFPLGITSGIGLAKFINACFYRQRIRLLLQDYLDYDSTIALGSRFSKNVLKALRVVKSRALIYGIIIASNGTLYILKPLVLTGKHPMEELFILYKLEPELETPNYELTYFLSAAGSFLTCYMTATMAALLVIAAGYVEAQLQALSEELHQLWNDSEQLYLSTNNPDEASKSKLKVINESIELKLRVIVKSHTTSRSFLLQVDDIFKGAFCYEFLILSIGLIAELLGGLENTYMLVPFAIIQVGMDCLIGQRVIDACKLFEDAVYGCKWERFDASNMKTVYIMLINSQKTLTLSAGGFSILNFMTLKSVFQSIYSAFTTLQSMI